MAEAKALVQYETPEGGYGKTVGSLEEVTPEGEFSALIRLLPSSLLGDSNPKSRLDDEIQLYLAVLPQGTEVLDVTQCAVVDLSIPYVVRFRNPLMKDFKEVQLEFSREGVVLDDKFEQFSLLTGVKYTRR
jgi:hypothetical protein